MKTRYTLQVRGLNIDNLLNLLYSKKFNISNIKKEKDNTHLVCFDINRSDYLCAMSDRVFDKFEVSVLFVHGWQQILIKAISLSGAMLGILISLIVGLNLSSKIWNIDVVINGSDDGYISQKVIETLSTNNVKVGSNISDLSLYDLSQEIASNNEEVATAVVEKVGTTLRVKIYLAANKYCTGDLKALRNGVVKDVLVGTGTAMVSKGDVVSEGDLLLKADSSGNAVGTILADVYYMGSVIYNENIEELAPTGKVKTCTIFELFNFKFGKIEPPGFEYYKLQVTSVMPFKNFFLPITCNKYEYREMVKKQSFVPFEKVEEEIKSEAKALAMQNLNSACQIVNIDYTIKREGSIVKVDCFVQSLENIAG